MAHEDPHLDVLIAAVAEQQHGIITRRQLEGLGASKAAVEHRVRTRRLYRLHRGVYVVGVPRPTTNGRFLGAVLACGDGTVASHLAAAAIHEIRHVPSGAIDVTIPRGGGRKQRGIRIHTTRSLEPDEITTIDGIPCTTWARTMVDLAAVLPRPQLERAIERSEIVRVFDLAKINEAIERANGKRGVATLNSLIAAFSGEAPRTKNRFERRFLTLIEKAALPLPIVNGMVEGYEVDFHWPRQKLIVETDGAETHATRTAFERDRQRDLDLDLAEWRVLRISWRQLRDQPRKVVAAVRGRLA